MDQKNLWWKTCEPERSFGGTLVNMLLVRKTCDPERSFGGKLVNMLLVRKTCDPEISFGGKLVNMRLLFGPAADLPRSFIEHGCLGHGDERIQFELILLGPLLQ